MFKSRSGEVGRKTNPCPHMLYSLYNIGVDMAGPTRMEVKYDFTKILWRSSRLQIVQSSRSPQQELQRPGVGDLDV